MATTDEWTRIRTILPRLPVSAAGKQAWPTKRLLVRPLAASDLAALHVLMTQPEVMKWTAAGRVHASIEETEHQLAPLLPTKSNISSFMYAICLRDDGDKRLEVELVGIGGVHRFPREKGVHGDDVEGGYGWPELGYLFKQEFWGQGLATEFVGAFLELWGALERTEVEMEVNTKSLQGDDVGDGTMAREMLVAIIDPCNGASGRVLQKCGFEKFDEFTEKHREDPDKSLAMWAFRYYPKYSHKAE